MTIIALPKEVKRIKNYPNKRVKWCYLGKDIAKREKITEVLGEENRFYLKGRLCEIAERFRQPYIDLVALLGKRQKNQLNWWASKFASKSHMQTDFFLLHCYKVLAIELLKQKRNNEKFIIFIEDPWLFADIKRTCKGKDIYIAGKPNLSSIRSSLVLRGVIRRLLLVGWIFVARLFIYLYHKGKKPEVMEVEKSAVLILNPAEMRAFDKCGRYVDSYMLGLVEFYKENKIPFFYLYMLRFSLSAAKYIGMNKENLWPLIYDIKIGKVLKRVFEYWKPVLNDNISNSIGGHSISALLDRERCLEFSSVGFNLHLILSDTLDRFFRRGWCRSIVYVFENQPWEKMLCMAARKNSVKLIGYQHSSISRLFLSQFIGKGESSFVPLPDKLVTSGDQLAKLYKEGGMPEDKIVVGGAWRYLHMIDDAVSAAFEKKDLNKKPVALITLCMDRAILKSMFENICKAISKNDLNKKIEFWVKPHPADTRNEMSRLNRMISKYPVVNEPFDTLLKKIDIIISTASVSGLEAFLCGKKVILYMPENLLAADPLMDISNERIYKWHEGEGIDINFLNSFSSLPDPDILNTIRKQYFSGINREIWLKHVTTKRKKDESQRWGG
jgi:hypothetical protein